MLQLAAWVPAQVAHPVKAPAINPLMAAVISSVLCVLFIWISMVFSL